MEQEFTAKDMVEFARWYAEDIQDIDLQAYREHLKAEEEREYQLYLSLRAKYWNRGDQITPIEVNRVEVIDRSPGGVDREFIKRVDKGIELSFQDEGKTLKIFLS